MFSVGTVDATGHVLRRQDLRREALMWWRAQVPAGTVVAMEACRGAHHWARRGQEYGLQPRLMAAPFIKPFRKSRRLKTDRNDAEALATTARQGNMRFVTVKSTEPQARRSWHRIREGYQAESLAISNRLRGWLAEFGIVMAKGNGALRQVRADLDRYPELPAELQELLGELSAHWTQVREHRAAYDTRIKAHAKADVRCVRIRTLIGIGPLSADAAVASIGSGRDFKNGRQLSTWLGRVPTQYPRLGKISRHGDSYLRT